VLAGKSSGTSDIVDSAWPEATTILTTRPSMAPVPVDDGLAVYDDVGQVIIMLNSSASAVWRCCDGHASFEQIVADLARCHSVDTDELREDVWRTMRKLASLGLVSDARAVP